MRAVLLRAVPVNPFGGAVLMLTVLGLRAAVAGPPFLTDDPEPVDYGHSEFYVFATDDRTASGESVAAPAFEYNHGIVPQGQFHLVVPYAESLPRDGSAAHGVGDVEIGLKYRFVEETTTRPQIGVFPMAELPTGDSRNGLGNGTTWWRLPVWLQKTYGPWTTYGGAGYVINRAAGQRDYAFAGWLVQRDLGARWTLGAEGFGRGSDAVDSRGTTIVNAGGYYKFSEDFNLLFSVGRSVAGEMHTVAYLGLWWTWGAGPRVSHSRGSRIAPRWSLARR